MVLASSEDVAARLGRQLTPDEEDRAEGLLEEASVSVTGWLRCSPDPVPDAVRVVVSRMVARVLLAGAAENAPAPGVDRISATMGPFLVNRGFSSDASSGGVWLARQDKMMLRPYGCRGRAGNVPTSQW